MCGVAMKTTALMLVLAIAFSFDAAAQTNRRDGCIVPSLIGRDRAAAARLLNEAHLSMGRVESKVSSEPSGTIIDQQPQPCGELTYSRTVDVVVSSGPRPTQPQRPEVTSGDGKSHAVGIGIAVGAAATAAILAARAANRGIKVPDLVKSPLASAQEKVKRARLEMGEVTQRESTTIPAGVVIEQSPAAGTRVERGALVMVTVSQGRPMTVVPNVAGQRWHEAEATVTGARLRTVTTNPPSSDEARLVVVSQNPEAGTPVFVGASVGITLQTLPRQADVAPTPTPPPTQTPPTVTPAPPRVTPAPPRPDPPRDTTGQRAPDPPTPAPTMNAPPIANSQTPGVDAPSPPNAAAPSPTPIDVPRSPPSVPPLRSEQPPANETQPVQIILMIPPGLLTIWPWLWLFLLAVAGALIAWRKRLNAAKGAVHVTFIPRLDAGRQAIITTDARRSHTFDLSFRIDPGTQQLLHRDSLIVRGVRT